MVNIVENKDGEFKPQYQEINADEPKAQIVPFDDQIRVRQLYGGLPIYETSTKANSKVGEIFLVKSGSTRTFNARFADTSSSIGFDGSVQQSASRAYLTSAQQATHQSWTLVHLGSESYDNDSEFDTTNYRFVPKKAGFYICTANVEWADEMADNVQYKVAFYKDNSLYSYTIFKCTDIEATNLSTVFTDIIYLQKDEPLELWVVNLDVALDFNMAANSTFMAIVKIN